MSLSAELVSLISSRSESLSSACGVKGQNDRIDALTLFCRDLIRSSTLCLIDGEVHSFDGRVYVPVSRRDVVSVLGDVLTDRGV